MRQFAALLFDVATLFFRHCGLGLAVVLGLTATGGLRAAVTLNPSNGHFYDAIPASTNIVWDDALIAAAEMTHLGLPGHLATITSMNENDFIMTTFSEAVTGAYRLGGTQPPGSREPDGGWTWITGEALARCSVTPALTKK